MKELAIAHELESYGYVKYNPASNGVLEYIKPNDIKVFKKHYQELIIDPYSKGNRFRSYMQFRLAPKLEFGFFEPYSQSKEYNPITGGIVRDYEPISDEVMETDLFNNIISHDINVVSQINSLPPVVDMMCGIHFFRYQSNSVTPSYSSPSWLHRDDENVVFIHLIDRSADIIGGDNVIAQSTQDIEKVISLDDSLDTLIVNHMKLHAVTPMAAPDNYGPDNFVYRDIILVTFQIR